jgi:hypothetical protein
MEVCGKDIKVEGRLIRTARLGAERFEYLEEPEAVVDYLRHSRSGIDLFTFMQRLPHTAPAYDYPMEWDNMAALPVSTFEHWWTRQIDGKTRNMVRRAEKKGLTVREVPFDDALVRGIWEIYNECPVRQGRRFPHYGKDIPTVRQMSASFMDSSIFIGAYLDEALIGFMKLTHDEARSQAAVMHIISLMKHRDKSPMNALIAQAVRSCESHKTPYIVYASFAYGKKQRDTLSDFKESNGFQRIEIPRYYIPLSVVGRAALRLGLHYSLASYLPESVLERLRRLRSTWYSRKREAVAQSS